MSDIVFLQVDAEDKASVVARFPDATITSDLPEDIAGVCKDATIVSSFIGIDWNKELLSSLPKLKLLCTRSVGFNHIDLGFCHSKGITVCHVPDYGSHVIAEHVFALLLSKLRHIPEADQKVESGEFDYHGLRGVSLRGKTLGIVGTGKIGRKTAQIAAGFGMKIVATDKCRTIELISHKSVVSTPHIAFYAEESMRNMYEDCFDAIAEFQSGKEPTHIVHPPTVVCDLPGVKKA